MSRDRRMSLFTLFLALFTLRGCFAWIQYPSDGTATMTHYYLPKDFVTACGCTGKSTHYPTAALSQMAYGSSTAFGPGCGRCFKVTLLNTYTPNPPFYPNETKSLTLKVTDLCPMNGDGWCSATESQPNPGGQYLNFDLAFPSDAVPEDFFPSNEALYGFSDFGVWNVSYSQVPCTDWAGGQDQAALGSVPDQDASGVCCPADPYTNSSSVCPSYSDNNGIAPDTTTTGSAHSLRLKAAPRTMTPVLSLLLALGLFMSS